MSLVEQWKYQVNAGNWRKIFIAKWTTTMRVFAVVVVHNTEIPTSGNPKSGDSFYLRSPPPPPEYQWSTPPTHPLKHNLIQSLIGLGHYMKSYMGYGTITISVYDCNGEIIFVTDEIHAKMPQKPNFDWKKIRILGENGIIPNQSTENLITRFYPGDLLTRTGRDCCRIRESWHVW